MDDEIANLVPYETIISETRIKVIPQMAMTLIDGKVLNFVTGTASSQSCPICGSSPKMFNNLANLDKFRPRPGSLQYGLSPLHARIRIFELLLHISYRLPIKKWSARGNDKAVVEQRKLYVQGEFWSRLKLRVDYPQPGGAGSSNDGNTARRAFSNYTTLAEILDIDVELIRRFKVILETISHSYAIDPVAFQKYCSDTAELYVSKYNWYYMSASCHKILIHGADIVRNSLLPIGTLSEQPAESKNKHYRWDRLHHTRKSSRLATMTDLMYRSIDFSDPKMSTESLRHVQMNVRKEPFDEEARQLMLCPDPPVVSQPIVRPLFDEEIEEGEEQDEQNVDVDPEDDDAFLEVVLESLEGQDEY